MKNQIFNYTRELLGDFKYYLDYFLFLLVVLSGAFMKVYLAIQKGKKPTWTWFLAEILMSFFVALSVYAVFDQFLHFNKLFTYMACAWGGSMSTLLHNKMEELISSIFESLKQFFNQKLTNNDSK